VGSGLAAGTATAAATRPRATIEYFMLITEEANGLAR
jgi:hypothetical protein